MESKTLEQAQKVCIGKLFFYYMHHDNSGREIKPLDELNDLVDPLPSRNIIDP